MAISDHVRSQLFREAQLIRIPVTRRSADAAAPMTSCKPRGSPCAAPRTPRGRHGVWTKREHALFLEALDKFPAGPWKAIAEHVGSKTARQAMTHGQKYRQKIARRQRGLKKHVRDLGDDEDSDEDMASELEQQLDHEEVRLSVEAALPVSFSDEEFAAFLANMDVQLAPTEYMSDSPLFVPDTPADALNGALELDDGFSLDAPALEVSMDTTTPADPELAYPNTSSPSLERQHLAVMLRADVVSDEMLSPMLLAALHRGSVSTALFDEDDMEEMAPFLSTAPANVEWDDAMLDQEIMLALMDPMAPAGSEADEPLNAPFLL
jgi:SHAQKYF class myb-like DNA-binding protein